MKGLQLFTVSGIQVRADWSLLIIFALITFSLAAGLFPAWHPQWTAALAWSTAFAAAVLFFGSVLVHELSHAFVGRLNGINIRRITLFVFGGMAEIEHEPERWRAELWMAIVGPITSLLIGVACLLLAGSSVDASRMTTVVGAEGVRAFLADLSPAATLLLWLGQVNVVLAIFNLVPGFPLDGGRVLRAIAWGITGDLRRATRLASGAGQVFAWILIATGVALMLGANVPFFGAGPINGLWLAFIGWFLNNAALMSYRQLLVREALQDVPVSRLMLKRFEVVTPQMPVSELIEERLLHSDQRSFPVLEADRLLGIVTLWDIERADRSRRSELRVEDIMRPVDELGAVRPDDDVTDALRMFAQKKVSQLPVVADGHLAGLLRSEDIMRWLALHDPALSSGPGARR